MSKFTYSVLIMMAIIAIVGAGVSVLNGCDQLKPSSDDTQRTQQEVLLQEATSQVGMPAIKNFRERKMLKDIYELRDQNGLVTYTYIENQMPSIVHGKTALGGKLTYIGESIGYGIPYATQFTNPQKIEQNSATGNYGWTAMPQADPNGLFSPSSASGTWVLLKNPHGKDVQPVYIEPNIVSSPFPLDMD